MFKKTLLILPAVWLMLALMTQPGQAAAPRYSAQPLTTAVTATLVAE